MRIFSELEDGANHGAEQSARDLEQVGSNLSSVKATLVLSSAKGGTGKSALAVNLAGALALSGRKVGILDADLNAPSILQMLGIKPPMRFHTGEGIEPASALLGIRVVSGELLPEGQPPPISFLAEEPQPAAVELTPAELSHSGSLRRLLGQSRFGPLDLLIVDLAPGLEQLYRLVKFLMPTGVLLVTQPSANSARALRRAVQMHHDMEAPLLGAIENMVGFNCDSCRSVRPLFPDGEVSRAAREGGIPIIARLPFDPRFAELSDRGKIFVSEYPDTPISKHLSEMAKRVETLLAAQVRKSAPAVIDGVAAPAVRQD